MLSPPVREEGETGWEMERKEEEQKTGITKECLSIPKQIRRGVKIQ